MAARLTHLRKLANIKQMLQAAFSAETYRSVQRTISLSTHRSSLGSKLSKVWNIWDKSNQYKNQQTKRVRQHLEIPPGSCWGLFWNMKTKNTPMKYRLAALPAALRGTTTSHCRKMNHAHDRETAHIYTHQTDYWSGLAWRRAAAHWSPRHSACNYPKQTASSEEGGKEK